MRKIKIARRNSVALFLLLITTISAFPNSSPYEQLLKQAESLMYSNPKKSSYYSYAAYNKSKQTTDSIFITKSLMLYGQAIMLQGDFDISLGVYYDALDYCPKQNKRLRASIDVSMGMLYRNLRDFSKAFHLIDGATSIYKSLNDSAGIAVCYNSRGIIHTDLNENEMADTFFKKALKINRKKKYLKAAAGNINNMCMYEGNTKEKISMLYEAIAINKSFNAIWSVSENYNNLGVQYFFAKKYNEALEALKMAREYALQIKAKELMCDNYRYLSWVYNALGNHKLAYDNLLKLYDTEGKMQTEKRLRNIEQDILEKRQIIQQKEVKLKEQTSHIAILRKNVIILLLILGILIVGSLLGIKWYKKKKNFELIKARYLLEQSERVLVEFKIEQQKKELESINSELETTKHDLTDFAFFIKSRNDLLDKIRNMIKEGYKLDQANVIAHLKKINAFIGQYNNPDEEIRNITKEVELKNREFIMRLMDKHPDLTPSEKKLATLLRINLTTKEISLLTGVIPKSINMSRYRLRKRLNLNTDDDIYTYLQSF